MGLDTTHDCWHGAYSAFTRWRNQLAITAGLKLTLSPHGLNIPDLPWDRFDEKNLSGEWDRLPEDPLLILLVHSDCDGLIHWEHAEHLAKRLEQLLPKMPTEEAAGHIGRLGWQRTTQRFIDGLHAAHAAEEDVEFG